MKEFLLIVIELEDILFLTPAHLKRLQHQPHFLCKRRISRAREAICNVIEKYIFKIDVQLTHG